MLPSVDAVGSQKDPAGDFRVRRVKVGVTGARSWSLVGSDRMVVEPVERYLAWLTHIERSPNTVRAYAHDLKLYWSFLAASGLEWQTPTIESLGEFVAWMRRPAANIVVLVDGDARRGRRTVNRALSAVLGFYECALQEPLRSELRYAVQQRRDYRRVFGAVAFVQGLGVASLLDGDHDWWDARLRGRGPRVRSVRLGAIEVAFVRFARVRLARLRDRAYGV